MKSHFQIAVITDELSQDFVRACEIASREFGMDWIELRSLWNKNLLRLDANEILEAQRILRRYSLRVTNIASPLFKTDWPAASLSKLGLQRDQFNADFTFAQQDEVLERALVLAKTFATDRVRCFDFWRLDDPAPHRAAINEKLRAAAEKAGKHNITLLLENEPACNTATAAEAAQLFRAVQCPHLMLTWDPANAASLGEIPFPDGYNLLPKNRIGHCHCKDTAKKTTGSGYEWAVVGHGLVDWPRQFQALHRDAYQSGVSLEAHWLGAGTREESTRQCWAGMKEQLQKAGAL